jgi:hypothetical protein
MHGTNLGGALLLAAGLSLAAAAPGEAGVSADLNIRLGTRPAPVVVFEREPDVVLVPSTRVYYVGGLDYDLFRYGQFWYINDGGYWYRARNYRGPFGQIRFESVPRQVVYVPDRFHRHPMHPLGGPPGQMKKRERYDDDRGVVIIRGKDKGGRGHGRGRGRD